MRSLLKGQFPKHWQRKNISDLVFFQEGPGVRKDQFTTSGVKLLNVGNINNNKLDLSTTSLCISEKEAKGRYKHFLADAGDLIIACSGIAVDNFENKITFISSSDLPLCMNTSTMRFKVLDEESLDIRFFYRFLQTIFFKEQLRKLITGSAQLNFGPSHIKRIQISLPPLSEQKRIANILDKADALRKTNQALLATYDELLKATFLDMFGDPVTNPKGWKKKKLGDKIERIQIGPFGSQLHKSDYVDNGIPLVNPTNIKLNKIEFNDAVKITEEKYSSLPQYQLLAGDVVMARRGDLSKVALVTFTEFKLFCGTGSLFIRFKSNVNKVFITFLLSHETTTNHLENEAVGVTMPNLNKGIIQNIPLYSPPINLQNNFAQIVENIESQKALVKQSLQESEDLFNALVQKAFKGELTKEKAKTNLVS